MMNLRNNFFTYFLLLIFSCLFASCATNDVTEEEKNEVDLEKSANVVFDGFYPGDVVTRSSLTYGSNGLQLNWQMTDRFGIFPTAEVTENGNKQNDSNHTSQVPFTLSRAANGDLRAQISSDNSAFHFSSNYRYSAYTPYDAGFNVTYDKIPFDLSNQTQAGYVNMIAYYTGGGYNNADYKATEQKACLHLGNKDVLISPETITDDRPLLFYMRHVGAVARCFVKTPVGKKLRIRELMLVSDQKIFFERGYLNLSSHPFDETKVPSKTEPTSIDQVNNYGVVLPQSASSQITPDETSATDCISLKFDDGDKTQTHPGVWNKCSDNAEYGRYLLAYIMMYPINYNANEASVYIYVIADDENGNEVRYRTTKLASKFMCSGYVYQWTKTPTEDTPIELTATVLPWQDIVGGGINTDLEK